MPLKRIEECSLDDLFGLFEIEELTFEELKHARKKVLMLHPDKNINRDTTKYYEYFKEAYEKLESVFEFINLHKKTASSTGQTYHKEELIQRGFYEYCLKKGLKDKDFQYKFNEVFEKVYIPEKEGDGYGDWLKSEEGIYDKADLEGSRKKAMALTIVDKELKTLQDVDNRDIKDAYVQSILPIEAEKVYSETPRFSTVEEYQRYQAKKMAPPVTGKDAEKILRDKENAEYKSSLHMSYDLLKKTEIQSKRIKEVYSQFLKIEN